MAGQEVTPTASQRDFAISSSSTIAPSGRSSMNKVNQTSPEEDVEKIQPADDGTIEEKTGFEREVLGTSDARYADMLPRTPKRKSLTIRKWVSSGGKLRPFRLLRQDFRNMKVRFVSDWTLFNQLVFASAVYVFFTNILPGITFASDLYVLTGQTWGTIEVVFSTGLCGIIFSM
jgi:hypothetical protein